jgi:L-rhamnose mutarotase
MNMPKQVAFKMQLKSGNEEEYKRRHDQIWPELSDLLRQAGISDYAIFLDQETLTLFAVQTVAEENRTAELPQTAIMRKWWDYMADLMETNPNNSPVVKPLQQVFYLP